MLRRRFVLATLSLALAGNALAGNALAQAYPSGPIKFIVPFAAGSATDNGARRIADALTKAWNQTIVVENKVGANGILAAEAVARSKPDGQTVFITSNSSVASNVALFKKLPYDPLKDLDPITSIGFSPTILLVHPSVQAKTTQELIALAKAQPGKVNFGSGSASTRMSGEMLKSKAGIDITHIPYKSTPLALNDLIGGHIQMMFADPVTSKPQIEAGKVRALGITTAARYKPLPDIPTLIEAGLPEFELEAWTAVFVPAGTPQPIKDKLYAATTAIINSPEFQATTAAQASEARTMTPENLRKLQVREIELYRTLMKVAGIEPE